MLTLAVLTAPVLAQEAPSATQVKAALMYNFARYVEWPPGYLKDEDTLVFGVLGSESLNKIFSEMIAGKSVAGRKIEVRYFHDPAEISPTHILFISSDLSRTNDIVSKVRGKSVLTVSDADGFLNEGGIISFVTRSDKVRFEINVKEANRSGLKISSALIALADKVLR